MNAQAESEYVGLLSKAAWVVAGLKKRMATFVPEDFAWEFVLSGFGPNAGVVFRTWWVPVGPAIYEEIIAEDVGELLAAIESDVIWPELRSRIKADAARDRRTADPVERCTAVLIKAFDLPRDCGLVETQGGFELRRSVS